MKYFLFTGKNSRQVASAFAPKGKRIAHELISELENVNELLFDLELVKLAKGKDGLIESNDLSGLENIWEDFQSNTWAWPLCSEKLKTIISEHLTGMEGIDWLSAKINGNGEQRIYYIPRFAHRLDVLDTQKTMYNKITGSVIIPHFSLDKVKDYSIFHESDSKIPHGFYISEVLKKAIQKAKCTGVSFERTRVS